MQVRILLPLLFILIPLTGIATPTFTWYYGKIQLTSGQTLSGEVCYDESHNLVLFKNGGAIESITARDVIEFDYYDEDLEMLRKFIVLDYENGTQGYKSKNFFEVIIYGSFSILYRDNVEGPLRNADGVGFRVGPFNIKPSSPYAFYLYYNKEFRLIKSFKEDILPILRNEFGSTVDVFISDFKLKPKELEDQMMIVDYFNHFTEVDLYGQN